jgi:signal-transduction protein with cAMP-binding, CBS, and nucleotidyltransferase domain
MDAAALLDERKIGALLVRDGCMQGMLTVRDVIHTLHVRIADLPSLRVRDIMSCELILGRIEDTVRQAMGLMMHRHIRHLPVLDGAELAGMVSMGDLVSAELDAADIDVRMFEDYVRGRVPYGKTG